MFIDLSRSFRARLSDVQPELFCRLIINTADIENRRSCLLVPAPKLVEVDIIGIAHGSQEIIRGHRLTVMPLEIEIHAFPEALFTKQPVIHANHFSTLVIDRGGVEVIDLDVRLGSHRMSHGTGIFRKLGIA